MNLSFRHDELCALVGKKGSCQLAIKSRNNRHAVAFVYIIHTYLGMYGEVHERLPHKQLYKYLYVCVGGRHTYALARRHWDMCDARVWACLRGIRMPSPCVVGHSITCGVGGEICAYLVLILG